MTELAAIQGRLAAGPDYAAAQFAAADIEYRSAIGGPHGLVSGERRAGFGYERLDLRGSRVHQVQSSSCFIVAAADQQRLAIGLPAYALDMRELGQKLALVVRFQAADDDGP